MDAVVAPVLHKYVPPPVAVNVADDPVYIIPSFGTTPEFSVTVILTTGTGITTIVLVAVPVHPFTVVTETVYVVVDEGLTVIEDVVAPVLHT